MNTDPAEPPVVLLHGLATSADRTWRETGWIDILGDTGRRVVAPPLPGHDGPDAPTEPDAYVGFEAQVAALLPEGPIDAVGFSLGARTLLVLAAAEPTRFRRLVVAGVGDNLFRRDGSSAVLAAALESLAAGRADDEAAANPMVRHFATLASSCGVSLGALSALLRRPDPPDVTPELLAGVQVPVCVVLGDADFAGPAQPLLDALPDAVHVPLRGVDHFSTPRSFAFVDAALAHLGLS